MTQAELDLLSAVENGELHDLLFGIESLAGEFQEPVRALVDAGYLYLYPSYANDDYWNVGLTSKGAIALFDGGNT